MEEALKRLERAVGSLEAALGGGAAAAGATSDGPAVEAYDEFLATNVTPFKDAATALGGPYVPLGALVERGFKGVRNVLVAARYAAKPSDEELQAFAKEVVAVLGEAGSIVDKKSPAVHHQTAVQESLNALQWIFVSPAPAPFVQGALEAADFYFTKLLSTNKESPQLADHRNFSKFLKASLVELQPYIKRFHTTGVSWNPKGVPLAKYTPGEASAAASSAPAAPEDKVRSLAERLESLASKAGKGSAKGGDEKSDDPPAIRDFDAYVEENIKPFVAAARGLSLNKIADLTETAIKELRFAILAGTKSAKPTDEELAAKLSALMCAIGEAGSLPDKKSSDFNHQQAFAESAAAFQWIFVSPAPAPFVQGALESADFYITKVLTSTKDAPNKQIHKDFATFLKKSLVELQSYIKRYHTTGLTWNAKGGKFADFKL